MSGQPPRKAFPSFAESCYAPSQFRESKHVPPPKTVRIDTGKNTEQIIPAIVTSGPPTEILSQELMRYVDASVDKCVQYYVQQYMQQYMQHNVQQFVEKYVDQYTANDVLPNLSQIVERSVQNAMKQLAPQSAPTPAPTRAHTGAPVSTRVTTPAPIRAPTGAPVSTRVTTPAPIRATTPAPTRTTPVLHPLYPTPTPVSKDIATTPRSPDTNAESDEELLTGDEED